MLANEYPPVLETHDRYGQRRDVAVGKFWVSKRTAPLVAEALECPGGNGFVEHSVMPRLYREAPLNSIWEVSGKVIALDVRPTIYYGECPAVGN